MDENVETVEYSSDLWVECPDCDWGGYARELKFVEDVFLPSYYTCPKCGEMLGIPDGDNKIV